MSKKRIEEYIPKALEVLQEEFENGEIPKVYNGYISSFGANIMQSGLKPTLALFENNQANTEGDRAKLTNIILKVIDSDADISLLEYVLNNNEDILKQKIVDASIAIKLAIRTFKLKD